MPRDKKRPRIPSKCRHDKPLLNKGINKSKNATQGDDLKDEEEEAVMPSKAPPNFERGRGGGGGGGGGEDGRGRAEGGRGKQPPQAMYRDVFMDLLKYAKF